MFRIISILEDLALRELAADFLSKSNSRVVVRQLLAALKKRDRYVAIRAGWGLSLMKPRLVVPYLSRALHGTDRAVIKQAARALGRMGTKARAVLVAALEDRRRFVRYQAASGLWLHALRGFKSKEVERLLVGMLKGDKGHAALTLRHMQSSRKPPDIRHRHQTVFQRMGGPWIR